MEWTLKCCGLWIVVVGLGLAPACGGDFEVLASAPGGEPISGEDSESTDVREDASVAQFGRVSFVAVYEEQSAWTDAIEARAMVDTVFADFEEVLRTSGSWDATIEVFFTDDNTVYAGTSFRESLTREDVDAVELTVVPAWRKIVKGVSDATMPIVANGDGADFVIHFNVAEQPDNAGLLRRQMIIGLGAINSLGNYRMTSSDELSGPEPGARVKASRYDLNLVDLDGNAMIANYRASDRTFEVQDYRLEPTLLEWMDGTGGIFFRGVLPDGGNFDMGCGTFSDGDTGGQIRLNEADKLMSASQHPSWNTLDEPDYAFFRAMGYRIKP